jgi:hypothetical protein
MCILFYVTSCYIFSFCAAAVQLLHYWYTFIFSHLWLYTCIPELQAAMIVEVYLACPSVRVRVCSSCMLGMTRYCHDVGKAHTDPMMPAPLPPNT